jgi:hypothetical protein
MYGNDLKIKQSNTFWQKGGSKEFLAFSYTSIQIRFAVILKFKSNHRGAV